MKTWQRYSGIILPILAVAALAIWPTITGKAANRESVFTILKAVALASSLNILLGYTGYVSFGHIVFYGFGGYVGLYLLTEQQWSLWNALLAGGLASGLLAFLLGTAILRLRGAYFALATIGINEAMKAFVNNFELFGGPRYALISVSISHMAAQRRLCGARSICGRSGIAGFSAILFNVQAWAGAGTMNEDAAEVIKYAPKQRLRLMFSAIIPGMIGVLFFSEWKRGAACSTSCLH
jgi:branched-chain amino acid transport system permease protein